MSKIINLNGVMVDLRRVKSIIHNDNKNPNVIKIEFNKRKEYVFNPNIDKWEVQEYNDQVIIDFLDSDIAVENYFQMMSIWKAESETI